MATNTEYGSWHNYTEAHSPADTVSAVLGDFAKDYDVDGLVDAYTSAVNDELPDGITLNGREFFGPYPRPDDAAGGISAALERAELTPLLERFER